MKKIFIYTENYAYGGGGNKYLIDFINNIPSNFLVYLYSNKNGITKNELSKVFREYRYEELSVLTIPNMYNFLKSRYNFFYYIFRAVEKIFKFFIILYFKAINIFIFKKVLIYEKPDLVMIFNGGYPGGLSCLDLIFAANSLYIKTVLAVVSVPFDMGILKILYKNMRKYIYLLVVNAQIIKNVFITKLGFEERKIKILYNSINNDGIKVNSSCFNLKSYCGNKIILGFVGRIEKFKGIFVLLDAFKIVNLAFSQVFLILVGAGQDLEKAKKYAEKLKIIDNVLFTGFVEGSVLDISSQFDVFVFPSFWEGMPYVILESMSFGKIIISTDVGGVSEAINKDNGILVPSGDAYILADKVLEVIQNFKKYEYLGDNAKKTFIEKFSYKVFQENVKNILEY